MDVLKKFDLQHWWNLVAATGAAIAVAFFIAQLTHGFLLGMGLLLFGIGERINHSGRRDIVPAEISREPNVVGLVLDVFGTVLFGIGLFVTVFAP